MSQEPFSSWFSPVTKAIHSWALVIIIFIVVFYSFATLFTEIFG